MLVEREEGFPAGMRVVQMITFMNPPANLYAETVGFRSAMGVPPTWLAKLI
jgi:hypothetical protein